ncbi:hypothetical protein [Streptomyces caniferus]|uniref:hypothetical protein n=1 Tax=Streptomyces caniferus TaxID=285557 RepID=UPI0037FC1F5F
MGDHDRLVVDYTLLETSKKNLRDIRRVFEGITDHRDDISDIWGHESIAEEMRNFVNNWDNYRRELVDNVQDLGKQVETALKSFEKQDRDLKNASEKKHGKNGGK